MTPTFPPTPPRPSPTRTPALLTAVAVAALMVAISVAIGVGIMVGSFRQTVVSWLGQTLVADVYISAPTNTATRIDRVELVSANPRQAAEHMSRLIDRPITTDADGALRVTSGGTRGAFVFLDRATLEKRHPGVPLDGLPREGGVTLARALRFMCTAPDTTAREVPVAESAGVR